MVTGGLCEFLRTGFTNVPNELVDYLIASEYATLRFLESSKIPSPRVFAYGLASDSSNRVGVGYIIMEALPGTPYNAYKVSPEQRQRVIQQVANILIEISEHPLPLAGSFLVHHQKDQIEESAVASNRFISLACTGPLKQHKIISLVL